MGYFSKCLLAVHDLIQADSILAECFGAVALSGLVTVGTGSVDVTGTGDFQLELTAGDRIQIDDQISYIEEIIGPGSLTLATAHVAGAVDAQAFRAAVVFQANGPIAPAIGPPFCVVSGGTIAELEPGLGERLMNPVVWVHYLVEIPQVPLTDTAANLWDVGDRLARVLTDPGIPAVKPPAALLCVPRFGGDVQLTRRYTAAAQGIAELPKQFSTELIVANGWAFTYESISNPLEVSALAPPLW
jgi:hypothetical protein